MLERTKIMVVYGSGRSCTSGLARALHLAGWPMGDDLLEANSSNPWGHYEDRPVVELNDKILAFHEATWDHPPRQIGDQSEDLLREVRDYIGWRNHCHGGGQWGMKDPRLTWTWPYWQDGFNQFPELEPIRVAALRAPSDVALSLVERDGGNGATAYDLTRQYHDAVGRHFRESH